MNPSRESTLGTIESELLESGNPPESQAQRGLVLYQPSYPATGFAQVRLVSEAMRSVICISLFQASQHASRMAS
jgi:hypothetical protein